MTTYTAADFAEASFARHPNGHIAARLGVSDQQWRATTNPWFCWLSDDDMADCGWVPVREAADQPITLDALQAAWEGAEEVSEDNPVRDGDLVIERYAGVSSKAWGVFEAEKIWAGAYHGVTVRVLRRAPQRLEGAEALEALLDEWGDLTRGEEPTPLADWLAERGVRAPKGGEK